MNKFLLLIRRILLYSYKWIFLLILFSCAIVLIVKSTRQSTKENVYLNLGNILFDQDCLKSIQQAKNITCQFPVTIATDKEDLLKNESVFSQIQLVKINENISNYMLLAAGKTKKAFFRFETKLISPEQLFGKNRSIPNKFNLRVPVHIQDFFEADKNSKFLDCHPTLNRSMPWYTKRTIPIMFSARIAEFLEILSLFSVSGFLFNGSLLGWRRECSIIPHTQDVDIAMFANQHSSALLNFFKQSDKFKLIHMLGKPEDSFELSVAVDGIKIDLFYLYDVPGGNTSYTSSMRIPQRQQLKAIYPKVKGICKGDLHGHLVSLPCNVEELLKADYGNWQEDVPTSQYIWDKTSQNLEYGKVHTEEEFKELYHPYFNCC
uniref:Fukutin n=1 Tax=Ditylenchus dipsaci TaxID=166011 RepID=A0A915EBA9_9BILA